MPKVVVRNEFDFVPLAEHEARLRRVQSVSCPKCKVAIGKPCMNSTKTGHEHPSHSARWAKYYKENPDA